MAPRDPRERPDRRGHGADRRDRPGGRLRARPRARGRADPRHGAAALRPARASAGRRSPTAAATCSTADAVTALVSDADVVVHLAFMIMGGAQAEPRGQPRRLPQRVRGGAPRRRETARLCILGRRLRLPSPTTRSRSPRTSRCAAPASHYYSAQKAEVEAAAVRRRSRPHDRGLRVPPVHRRRARARRC